MLCCSTSMSITSRIRSSAPSGNGWRGAASSSLSQAVCTSDAARYPVGPMWVRSDQIQRLESACSMRLEDAVHESSASGDR